ncbi:MAG: hypothetical protein AAGA42_11195 [Actinomycetota bacterium]
MRTGNIIEIRIRTVIWTATVAALSIAATLIVTSAWSADAAPGDDDATYVPKPGCRAFDLRPAPNQVGPRPAPLAAGEVYTQQITGNVGDCTGPLAIPADAVAVAMNVTAVGATAQTNLRLFPANLTDVPTLSNLNVSAGQAPFPNKVDVALSPDGAIKIFNQNGTVSVLGDIAGYYTKASLTELNARLAAVEAQASANAASNTAQDSAIAALDAAQPFMTFTELPVSSVTVPATSTSIRSIEVTAPVDGHVAVIANGYIGESTPGQIVECAVLDSISVPPLGVEVGWQAPTGGDRAPLAASNVFDIAGGDTAAYYLVCGNISGGQSVILAPLLTAIFTPAR